MDDKYIIKYFSFTDPGTRDENQDSFLVCTKEENIAVRNMGRGELFAVADGMGGHRAGREAAQKVCDTLFTEYYKPELVFDVNDPEAVKETLSKILHNINQLINKMGNDNPEYSGWGSTGSVLVITDHVCHFVHAGDTRIYRFRNGESCLLTEDQNIAYQMYIHDQFNYDEYLESSGHNKLLSYIGQGEDISVKTGCYDLKDGDMFLICSDGLNQFLQIRQIEDMINQLSQDTKNANDLFKKINQNIKESIDLQKAKDNVTYLLILSCSHL